MCQILNGMECMKKKYFIPTLYLCSGLLQTAYNSLSDKKQVNYQRQYISLSDGGQISLDWALPMLTIKTYKRKQIFKEYEPEDNNKIMFIVHGLTGGSDEQYIQHLVDVAQKQGFRCVVFNSRGVNTQMTSPLPSNGADLTDLNIALITVRNKYKNAPIFGVGTSFGGNQIIRWAGEQTKNTGKCFLSGIVGLSVPFDTQRVMNDMGKLYQYVLVDFYKKHLVIPHMDQLSKLSETFKINWSEVQQANDLHQFYNLTAVKIFGYNDIQQLFQALAIKDQHIENLNIPTLLLHSQDDPIVTQQSIPKEKLAQNKNIAFVQTTIGGHVCWFQGNQKPKRWYPEPTVQFFEQICEQLQKQQKEVKQTQNIQNQNVIKQKSI